MFGMDVVMGLWSLAGLVPLIAGLAAVSVSRRSAGDAVRSTHRLHSDPPGFAGVAGGVS